MHLVLYFGVLYLQVPTLPKIKPIIGNSIANSIAEFAVFEDS